jgi:predicted alpha/beta superfamily hydrolase
MKNVTFARLVLHILLGTWTLFASSGINAATGKVDPFVIGEKFQIESKVLKETRTYIIHTPPAYQRGKDAYPVLVLQDAEPHLRAVQTVGAGGVTRLQASKIGANILVCMSHWRRHHETDHRSASGE